MYKLFNLPGYNSQFENNHNLIVKITDRRKLVQCHYNNIQYYNMGY